MPSPTIVQIGQYLKDFSFENFALDMPAPAAMPAIEMNVDVAVRALAEQAAGEGLSSGDYETRLNIRIIARPADANGAVAAEAKPIFLTEISYAGRYRMGDVPTADLEPFLAVEAPRLLFPFVRQIVADAAMHGGLPPLLIAPVDFMAVYQQQKNAS